MIPVLHNKNALSVRLAPPLEVKLSIATPGEISGYGSVFDGPPDSYGDVIAPGAFARSLAELAKEGVTPSMLWSHRQDAPIGRWVDLQEDSHGLFVRGFLNLETTGGRDAYQHVKNGDVNGLSIGFYPAPNGVKAGKNGTKILTDINLVEISVVAMPANRRARASVKSLQSKNELIDLLREGGLPKAAATRVAAGGWSALANNDLQKIKELADRVKAASANLRK